MGDKPRERNAAIATELRWINWLVLLLYGIVAFYVFIREDAAENPFYPAPFRFYYGTFGMPLLFLIWLGYLITDLVQRFRWQWLAGSMAAGLLVIVGYKVIDAMTVVPG